jgi:nitrite reductase/ring-hydroxylating ferredoxin subunit
MFTKQDWDEAAKRLLHKVENNVPEPNATIFEVPVSYYLDEDRWKREVEVLFKKQPLILGFSCELAEPNAYKAMSVIDVPILLTRGDDEKLRGFINKCRHRGAPMTGEVEKCGIAKRFSCPYHAWTFDNKGALVSTPGQSKFGDVPADYRHLIEISVEEHGGLIWGVLSPGIALNLEKHLGAMLPLIVKFGVESFHYAGANTMPGGNWKLVQDGFIEHYHFGVLHKDSVGEMLLSDATIVDHVAGPHIRYMVPSTQISQLRDIPEIEWKASNYMLHAYFVFPCMTMGVNPHEDPRDQVFGVTSVWPGDAPGTSIIRQIFATPTPMTPEQDQKFKQFVQWQADFIQREDFWAIKGQQHGLASIADQNFIYGGLERIAQHFERNVNALVNAS